MRCAIYRRVSTDMQVEDGFSIEMQHDRLKAFANSQGWTIVDDFCDEGYSAKNIDRPQMQRLISAVKNNEFDIVLVYRLDRFVRSVVDLHELLQLLDKHNVKFKSATEIFDTTSATGRLFITLIATLAQWERETIAERVHMGQMKKAELGERNGAPAPYGYDLEDGQLIVNSEEAKWVKYIFNRYGSVGAQTIAKELNKKGIRTKKGDVFSDFAIRYILRNPIYTGQLRWNYETYSKGMRKKTGEEVLTELNQADFEPLITVGDFDLVQNTMEKRSTQAFRSDNFYPFSGVAKCDKCGYGFTGAFKQLKSGKIHRYYKCRGRISFGTCDVQSIAEEAIEEAFLNLLELSEAEIEIEKPQETMSLDDLQKQLAQLSKRKERAEELYIDGDITRARYNKLMEDIRKEEEDCLKQMSASKDIDSMETVKKVLQHIRSGWQHFSHETKKQAIHSLFQTLTIRLDEKAIPPNQKAKISITDHSLL